MNGKSAVTTLLNRRHTNQFRRLLIFFDKVYISEHDTEELEKDLSKKSSLSDISLLNEAKNCMQEVGHLRELGLLKTFDVSQFDPNRANEESITSLNNEISRIFSSLEKDKLLKNPPIEADLQNTLIRLDAIGDVRSRLGAFILESNQIKSAFPILHYTGSTATKQHKEEVLRFTLNKIPTPDESTSWEQIIEFRSDKDVQTSYLALINWINGLANSNKSLSDIEDEFNYLYNQYIRFYNIHKMKSKSNVVEILVSLGIDALTEVDSVGQYLKAMFNIRKTKISLMEEELKLPGREIAYIYKANEKFGK